MKRLFLLILLLLPTSAEARSKSAMAVFHSFMLGVSVERTVAKTPPYLSDRSVDQTSVWISMSGGKISNDELELGSELGFEYALRLGITPDQTDSFEHVVPFGFSGLVGLALRTLTFNTPFSGIVVVHLDTDFQLGGGHWWSDTPRLSFQGGLRLALTGAKDAQIEIDYTVVPFIITGSPEDYEVKRLEHRIGATIGADEVGLGVWLTLFYERSRGGETRTYVDSNGHAVNTGLFWRF